MTTRKIATVRGPVPADQLGWILPHEHVVCSSAGIWESYPELLGDHEELETRAVSALSALLGTRFRTIVDLTTHDLGRNIEFVHRAAVQSDIHIVAATGCWMDAPRSFYRRTPEEVAAIFVKELTEGIAGTSIRAGVIKVASEGPVSDEFKRIFRAAGIASRTTGAPVYTHSATATRDGFEQLDLLVEAGADPRRVCIGHSNDTADLEYVAELARRGCFIGLDRFPGDFGSSLQERIDFVVALIEAGLERQLLLSHDWAVDYSHSVVPRNGLERNPQGYRLISDVVLPGMEDAGISAETIQRICFDNPRRFLLGETV